jgi:ADP-heptose:LPS heptosyltransferase
MSNASVAERQAASRLEQFRGLRARGALCTEVTGQLATEAATAFLEHHRQRGEYLADAITLLSEIATLEEPCLSQPGQRATFPLLVERLSDSFDPRLCLLYDRAFAQMISHCRSLPAGKELDAALLRFGLKSERDLLERKGRLRRKRALPDSRDQRTIRKVLVPSRVTLGADVAITSIVLQKAKRTFPQAERVLLGSAKLRELFGGDHSLRIRQIQYAAEGGLLDRLQGWLGVLEAVEQESSSVRPEECIMMDPDSRLLQLGLLPALTDESRYFFFESRAWGEPGAGTIGRITLRWLHQTFGGEDDILPEVYLAERDREFGRQVCGRLRDRGSQHLVAASFGVGGNPEKRLPDPFEESLLLRLMEEGSSVVLDKGFGEEELERAGRLIARVKAAGWSVFELRSEIEPQALEAASEAFQMITWQGAIGPFSALLSRCDEYVGYDSAGQHIAAALGVPTLDIFTDAASPLFRERWRPCGKGIVKTICADRSNASAALLEALALHREIRSAANRS